MEKRSAEAIMRRNKNRAEAVTRFRQNQRKKAVEYKGGKCEMCGYSKCIAAFEFHHRDPYAKDFTLGSGHTRSWERVVYELDRCMLLCCRCHKEVHHSTVE